MCLRAASGITSKHSVIEVGFRLGLDLESGMCLRAASRVISKHSVIEVGFILGLDLECVDVFARSFQGYQ